MMTQHKFAEDSLLLSFRGLNKCL